MRPLLKTWYLTPPNQRDCIPRNSANTARISYLPSNTTQTKMSNPDPQRALVYNYRHGYPGEEAFLEEDINEENSEC